MRVCQTHWIQCRDRWEADYKLIAATMASSMILLDSIELGNLFKDIYKMQSQVEKEGGCALCFYQKYLQKNPLDAIEDKMRECPEEKMLALQAMDKQQRQKSNNL